MRLLSLNVGLPREIEWRGQKVRTAIWKHPVGGRQRVRRLNIDGDGQADLESHGGEQRAVFVYQLESYRLWEAELGRDDFVYGQFGENFTVEGLSDDDVCVGDRYRIGAAVFEVTQPRVTCYTEHFGPDPDAGPSEPPHPPAGTPGTGPQVAFARSRLTVAWDPAFASLLELAEACDVPADWSCRTGVCHRCETALVDGVVEYEPERLERPAEGNVLACCARPRTAVTLDL